MKKAMDFKEIIEFPIERVWNAIQDPSKVTVEWNAKVEKISDTEWNEIVNETSSNHCKATYDTSSYSLHIEAVNSKYDSETNDIKIHLNKASEDTTEISIHYEIGTTAIFNIIAMDVLGKKLVHHAGEVVVKNIIKLAKKG